MFCPSEVRGYTAEMESGQLKFLFQTLDDVRHEDGDGEYWLARELYPVLGYSKWQSFEAVLERAKLACRNSGGAVTDHFTGISKMVTLGSGAGLDKGDIRLTRYACYLVAVNGDPSKQEIAFAQAYFVTKTRQLEALENRMLELERLDARDKLKVTEKEFAALVISSGVDGVGLAMIKSRGDQELFGGKTTAQMKATLGIPKARPLADFLPNVTLKAKDLATAMTTENAKRKSLKGLVPIGKEHVTNNQNVREALVKTGIKPEELPAQEDIARIQNRHKREAEALQKRQQKEISDAIGNEGKLL